MKSNLEQNNEEEEEYRASTGHPSARHGKTDCIHMHFTLSYGMI